jgi:hypothetical protein
MLLYVATKNLLYHIRLIVISSPHKLLPHQTMPSPFSLDHGVSTMALQVCVSLSAKSQCQIFPQKANCHNSRVKLCCKLQISPIWVRMIHRFRANVQPWFKFMTRFSCAHSNVQINWSDSSLVIQAASVGRTLSNYIQSPNKSPGSVRSCIKEASGQGTSSKHHQDWRRRSLTQMTEFASAHNMT